jgi:ribonucleoside-diphosphate reductase alpha chain
MEPTAGLAGKSLVERYFTAPGLDPFDQITWNKRDVWVGTKYQDLDVYAPDFWSDNAVAITSKLYLSKGEIREKNVGALVYRIARKIADEGLHHGYFGERNVDVAIRLGAGVHSGQSEIKGRSGSQEYDSACLFFDELKHIMINQIAVFNSPVLFNVGRDDRPQQVSACFILGVDDTTKSIMDTSRREVKIFRGGSGSGFSVSRLRGCKEPLSTGGTSSGPVSFMRAWDAFAGTFKSGGRTRRAAILRECDADHPDIRDFITCKVREEERLWREREAGTNIGFDEEGERNVAEMTSFQNGNNSVGVTDHFMNLVIDELEGQNWPLIARKTGEILDRDNADELLELIAESAHACACPGMMFLDKMNETHTAPFLDGIPSPIRATNPCGEFCHNDFTSCNLASINILKFVNEDGSFDVEGFRHTVDIMTVAMDILVQLGYFPDELIGDRTKKLRPLGLGYSNMGAAIMAQGFAYDSDEGRDFAASVTALETGRVYRKSAQMSELLGPFHYWEENREAMLGVLRKQADFLPGDGGGEIWNAADLDWLEAISLGKEHGFRNSQATVVPPAGTTSYFLDCDTTGIEPSYELRMHKEMAGGGTMTIINQSVERGLRALNTNSDSQVEYLLETLATEGVEGFMRDLHESDEPVFHSANEISAEAHIRMMSAVQPFVSGAISKTINMPNDATVQDVKDAYILAWRLGCKDLAIYRNGSKARQPHSAKEKEPDNIPLVAEPGEAVINKTMIKGMKLYTEGPQATFDQISPPARRRLSRTRRSLTHKIHLQGQMGNYEGYVHAGMYSDGTLGEVFIDGFGKAGSFTGTALGGMATAFSIGLQYGVPFEIICRKFLNVSDETGGMVVPDPEASGPTAIRSAKSIIDYIARWIVLEFGDTDLHEEFGVRSVDARSRLNQETLEDVVDEIDKMLDKPISVSLNGHASSELGPQCSECGNHMRPTGGCFTCSCGNTTGCA